VYIARSLERKERPIAKQLALTAALCAALFLGGSLASAQSNVTIFSNLGPSSTNLYFTGAPDNGDCIVGADKLASPSPCGRKATETWLAMPFTPAKNSHATMLQAAVGFFDGTNQFELALFNDDNGVPGTALATVTVTDAPLAPANGGVCCGLATASLGSPGIALTANTQYWVVAKTDDVNAPDFEGIWAFSNSDFVAFHQREPNGQVAWFTALTGGALAFAVQGTVP
jgi:hypothetical protein